MPVDIFQEQLDLLEQEGRLRNLRLVEGPQQAEIIMDGRKVLNFCSNNYLGLANDRRIKSAAIQAIKRYGVGSGASRLVCGNMSLHEKLEERLAEFKQAERCLVYSSGYMANLGVISSVVGKRDIILADKLNHASLIDGMLLSQAEFRRYPHKDMQVLESLLKEAGNRRKLIVTDTVFSMDGDIAPLPQIAELAEKYQAMIMVDEAHATGVLGKCGKGAVKHFNLEGKIDIQMGTLSKAIGSHGAYICGKASLINFLINKSRQFIYTTALPVAFCAAAIKAIEIIEQDSPRRKSLLQNAAFFKQGIKGIGLETTGSQTAIIPVITRDDKLTMEFSRRLFKSGIFVQGIRPPTVPVGAARLRVTVMATHQKNDLEKALKAFKRIAKSLGII
jgi:glycine C-acetyltransferase